MKVTLCLHLFLMNMKQKNLEIRDEEGSLWLGFQMDLTILGSQPDPTFRVRDSGTRV